MIRNSPSVFFGILLLAVLLTAATCRKEPLDLPVPDPQPVRPFEKPAAAMLLDFR